MSNAVASTPQVRRNQAQRRADTEERVISAAVALIAERGSRAVSLAEVGRLAGYSRGIVNHHFGTKQNLLTAVVKAARQFEVPAFEGDGLTQLLTLVSAYLRNLQPMSDQVRAFLLLWAEALAADPVLQPLFDEQDRWFRALLAKQVRHGIEDRSIRCDTDAESVAVALLGLLRGIGMQLMSNSLLPESTDVQHTAVEMIRRGLQPV